MNDSSDRTNDHRVVLWLLMGLVVLFGGLYVAGYLFTSDKVPRGTSIAGVAVGGQSPQAAERSLVRGLADRIDERLTFEAAGKRLSTEPKRAGLSLDASASVSQAGGGRSWAPGRMWNYFTGGDDFEAVVSSDDDRLGAVVDAWAAKVDKPAVDGAVTFDDGQASTTDPREGRALDRAAAAVALRAAFLSASADSAQDAENLPVTTVDPEITSADVDTAMDEFANPAMSGPVTFRLAGESVVLRPAKFSKALSMEAMDGKLVPRLDDKVLLAGLEPAMKTTALAPRDADVRLVDGRPKVIPAKTGVTFDPEKITGSFLKLLVASGKDRTLRVKTVVDKPDFTTADARKLGIVEQVSEFTTYFPYAAYRNTNLGRAAHLINGTVMKPGETFSLNKTVGERTAANGFVKGFIISNGVFKEDFGGGVSQVATTTYNAAFFAGFEDVEHKAHSFYIDRYPVGREATVAWGAVDLRFKVDTPYGALVQAWIVPASSARQGEMHVRIWSTKVWDISTSTSARYNFTKAATRHLSGAECVPNTGYGGFDIDVYRYFRKPGSQALDHKETIHTRYTPSDSVVCS